MDRLQRALDFDEAELSANRAGKFSSRQAARLESAQANSTPILWGMILDDFDAMDEQFLSQSANRP